MDGGDAPRRASFGAAFGFSLLVALGWYVMVPAALFAGRVGTPVAPDRDCSAMLSCLSPLGELWLLVIFAAPLVAGALVITVPVAALLVRPVRSPIVAGTVSAFCGVVGAAAFAAVERGVL